MASEVKDRLLEFLRYKRMSQVEFTRLMGVSGAYVAAMRRSLSDDKVNKLRKLFPDLNITWLLYGDGEMIADKENSDAEAPEEYLVPLLPVAAFAGDLQSWSQGCELPQCEKIVAPVRGADFAIRISGDSMEPVIHNGSTLFIKRINDRAFVPWGNSMVIDTENGVLVKNVYPIHDNPKSIEARSYNPHYPPIQIPTDSIYGLYRILTSVTTYSTM